MGYAKRSANGANSSQQCAPVTLFWYDGDRYQPPRPEELEDGEELIPIPAASWAKGRPFGALVVGEKGKIAYGSHGAANWRILGKGAMEAYVPPAQTLPRSQGHHKEWLEACKGGQPAGANFDYGGPLAEIAMVGNIGLRMLGTRLEWDAGNMTFPNCPPANEYLHFPYKKGWAL